MRQSPQSQTDAIPKGPSYKNRDCNRDEKRERGAESLNVLCSITHCCTPFGVYA